MSLRRIAAAGVATMSAGMGGCQPREHPGQPDLGSFGASRPPSGGCRSHTIDAVAGDRGQPETPAASECFAGDSPAVSKARSRAMRCNRRREATEDLRTRTADQRAAHDDLCLRPRPPPTLFVRRRALGIPAIVIEVDGDAPRRVAQHLEQLRAVKHRDRHAEPRDEFARRRPGQDRAGRGAKGAPSELEAPRLERRLRPS